MAASRSLRHRIDASEVALWAVWAITGVDVVLLLAVAVAALYMESYEAAKTLGGKWDYLALLGAAFVAGGAGTYAAFLNPWSPKG
jgi:hypothetical protein